MPSLEDLSLEDVEKLIQEAVEARGKLVDRTPEEWREWFDRMFKKAEKMGPPKDYWLILEEDKRLARERERLAREEEEENDDEPT